MQKYYHTTLRLWKLLQPFHKHFYLQLFYNAFDQGLRLLITYLMALTLNSLISKDINFLIFMAFAFPVANFLKDFIGYALGQHNLKHLDQNIYSFLQSYSLKKIFELNASQYLEDHSSIKLQVIDRGETAVENVISTLLVTILPVFIQVLFTLIIISFYSIWITVISLLTLVTILLWANNFSKFHRPLIRNMMEKFDFFRKIRTEAFQHLGLIKVSGVDNNYLKEYTNDRKKLIYYFIEIWTYSGAFAFKRNLFLTVSRTITIFILVYLFINSKISTGSVYAVWSWVNDLYGNVNNIVRTIRQIPLRFIEIEKYLDIIDKKPEFSEDGKENFVAGDIAFKNLNFKYPKSEQDVLKNINLTIPYGKKVAFVGTSGSGKSTIIKLLLRIYDFSSGEILVAGKSIRNINTKSLRHNIGYVEQHVDLFDSTIRENILFGITVEKDKNKISEEKLSDIIHKSRIDQFFHRLSEFGLDTIIGERGVKLSGGERQRIGIARALIKDPAILIFDEATASLDTENEKYIQEAIDESSLGRTSIIIAHRLSTVQNADIIFVIDKGNLVGSGTHFELLENCEEYKVLIHNQHRK